MLETGLILVLQGGFFFCFLFIYFFNSLQPHKARGKIKDWWEFSESVYCSRDLCLCYEWKDCVAVLPHRRSWGWFRAKVFDNQGWIFFFTLFVLSRWHKKWLQVAISTTYLCVKCDETVVLSKRGGYVFPDFKVDRRISIADYTWAILNKFLLFCFFTALNLSKDNLNCISSALVI